MHSRGCKAVALKGLQGCGTQGVARLWHSRGCKAVHGILVKGDCKKNWYMFLILQFFLPQTHAHTHTYTHTHIHIHTYLHTYIHIYQHTYKGAQRSTKEEQTAIVLLELTRLLYCCTAERFNNLPTKENINPLRHYIFTIIHISLLRNCWICTLWFDL